jgi:hypothetical protein
MTQTHVMITRRGHGVAVGRLRAGGQLFARDGVRESSIRAVAAEAGFTNSPPRRTTPTPSGWTQGGRAEQPPVELVSHG